MCAQQLTYKDELLLKNVREGRVEEVLKLVILGANVNAKHQGGSTSLHLATVNGDFEMVKLLLDLKVDVNAGDALGLTALHEAAGIGHTEMAVYLAECGADMHAHDEDGDTPLKLAEDLGHIKTVKALEKLELDVGKKLQRMLRQINAPDAMGMANMALQLGQDVRTQDQHIKFLAWLCR